MLLHCSQSLTCGLQLFLLPELVYILANLPHEVISMMYNLDPFDTEENIYILLFWFSICVLPTTHTHTHTHGHALPTLFVMLTFGIWPLSGACRGSSLDWSGAGGKHRAHTALTLEIRRFDGWILLGVDVLNYHYCLLCNSPAVLWTLRVCFFF